MTPQQALANLKAVAEDSKQTLATHQIVQQSANVLAQLIAASERPAPPAAPPVETPRANGSKSSQKHAE
ncbi:MAG TPA: hypothetical protein VLV86_12160 [Vicinamibacterales bacterium]|nr:hypothetical protein [Vicinamibacterales bacterium]